MFARIVECNFNPENKEKLRQTVLTVAVDIVKKYPGFIDALILFSDTEPNVAMVTTLWRTKEDCERYQREGAKALDSFRPFLKEAPIVRNFVAETVWGSVLMTLAT
jgi:heme-degrading monooxygenase HmoA